MSFFSDRPQLSFRQKLGCGIYMMLGILATPILFLFSLASGCPAFAPARCVPASQFEQFMWFPGSVLIIFVTGFLMLKFFLRDRH